MYPNADTNTTNTINPIQQPTTKLSLLVNISAMSMYVLENGLSIAAPKISIVLTLVHLLLRESFICGRRWLKICSSEYKLFILVFSGERAIRASGTENPVDVEVPKLPSAITQTVYRDPGDKL